MNRRYRTKENEVGTHGNKLKGFVQLEKLWSAPLTRVRKPKLGAY